ncbi:MULTISPECIES: hypothetical protein [unclassified Oceanobacillus]|uniref:hypothetical protein n=1 Tax=unclassified Oceanobacillus TaxID=2630292 RepID=UPI001BEAB9F3|nr:MULTISPECIES: hypothetical protein [unclassified Oceanobacillus]MBT2601401.1 hypothetical protein [Oceanobacillus sp. ISL-74]MBT2653323.1 hypothetical protein [Oceanobacillus sp. ISL-73]
MGAFVKGGIKDKQEDFAQVAGVLHEMSKIISKRSDDMELLTTGQMIDQLKVGEVARNDNDSNTIFVKRAETGGIYKCFKDGTTRESAFLVSAFVDSKWRILPNYVSFEDAMKALKDGKTVELHIDGKDDLVVQDYLDPDPIREFCVSNCTFKELLEGKWTIEE